MMKLSKYYVVALLSHFPSSVELYPVFDFLGFCIRKAKELKLMEALKEDVSREHCEKALVMELAVMAAFGVDSGETLQSMSM